MEAETQTTAIGIDFGGTSIKCGAVQGSAIIERGGTITTSAYDDPVDLLEAVAQESRELVKRYPEAKGVGIGLPGFVNTFTGMVESLTNVPGWNKVCVAEQISQRIGVPVVIENDATAMTYAEWRYGAARGKTDAVCLTMGTGVGGGLILGGRLHRGAKQSAGEIGMMTVDYKGIPGPYGNRGFVEGYVGNRRIVELAQRRYMEAGYAASKEECQPHLLAEASSKGDQVAVAVWEEVGVKMGAMLADLVWALAIDTIVIGGGVSKAGEVLFGPIRRALEDRLSPFMSEGLQVLPASFSNDAGMIGSAALAVERAEGRHA